MALNTFFIQYQIYSVVHDWYMRYTAMVIFGEPLKGIK